jgi:hypothetical protein
LYHRAVMTSLVARFTEYLKAGADKANAPGLAAALGANGYPMEADLLNRDGWTDGIAGAGVWSNRKVFVGRRPPLDATIGELWLDVVEVTPMVLVEEPARGTALPPRKMWMSIRPVARWQFRAFAVTAPLVGRKVQVAPRLKPMDPTRLDGDDAVPMTDVTFGEGCLYAWWLGKWLADVNQWEATERSLGAGEIAAMWDSGVHEWGGYGGDEDARVRISASNWRTYLDDYGSAEGDILVGAYTHYRDTGLRTVAEPTFEEPIGDLGNLPTMEPIALVAVFRR